MKLSSLVIFRWFRFAFAAPWSDKTAKVVHHFISPKRCYHFSLNFLLCDWKHVRDMLQKKQEQLIIQ